MSLLEFFYSLNAAVSRNLCAVRLVVKLSDSETTRRTARKLSVCTALLDAFSLYLSIVYKFKLRTIKATGS